MDNKGKDPLGVVNLPVLVHLRGDDRKQGTLKERTAIETKENLKNMKTFATKTASRFKGGSRAMLNASMDQKQK